MSTTRSPARPWPFPSHFDVAPRGADGVVASPRRRSPNPQMARSATGRGWSVPSRRVTPNIETVVTKCPQSRVRTPMLRRLEGPSGLSSRASDPIAAKRTSLLARALRLPSRRTVARLAPARPRGGRSARPVHRRSVGGGPRDHRIAGCDPHVGDDRVRHDQAATPGAPVVAPQSQAPSGVRRDERRPGIARNRTAARGRRSGQPAKRRLGPTRRAGRGGAVRGDALPATGRRRGARARRPTGRAARSATTGGGDAHSTVSSPPRSACCTRSARD